MGMINDSIYQKLDITQLSDKKLMRLLEECKKEAEHRKKRFDML